MPATGAPLGWPAARPAAHGHPEQRPVRTIDLSRLNSPSPSETQSPDPRLLMSLKDRSGRLWLVFGRGDAAAAAQERTVRFAFRPDAPLTRYVHSRWGARFCCQAD